MFNPAQVYAAFQTAISGSDALATLQAGLIGSRSVIETPFGPQRLLYADYTASGRALTQIEDFIRDEVLPYYANTHTEASYCGMVSTQIVRAHV